ncbi:WXG100 family type VII secretion target [Bilifractor porci]|uniref:ESAT-6-like protein n=1 Tax=Bilifractor porci TaxID=2606636 RepID=A0A7X2PA99_9FIRM|nr:WXG100 family type VII secretion target [Bilifractor porci]MST82686.1 hypothetical protein [Bilifractor porci]
MYELIVAPEKLKAQAEAVKNDIRKMQKTMEMMATRVRNTKSYWKGDAGESFRGKFEEQNKNAGQVAADIRLMPDDLLKIAGIYEETEAANKDMADALLSGMIRD